MSGTAPRRHGLGSSDVRQTEQAQGGQGDNSGLRLGEVIALTWKETDIAGQRLKVERQLLGPLQTEKLEHAVDMADPLFDELRDLYVHRREDAFRAGTPMSPWVLFPDLP